MPSFFFSTLCFGQYRLQSTCTDQKREREEDKIKEKGDGKKRFGKKKHRKKENTTSERKKAFGITLEHFKKEEMEEKGK